VQFQLKHDVKHKEYIYSQVSFIRTQNNGIPAIRHKSVSNGFLPMHFTPLIRKPRCLTPTRKFWKGYVKSIEKIAKPDYANCYLLVY